VAFGAENDRLGHELLGRVVQHGVVVVVVETHDRVRELVK
jgi:hypothetical protein